MADITATEEMEVRPEAKKVRVQLDFDPADFETINRLKEELGLGTRAELFRSGIRALRWMSQKEQQGCTVVAVTPQDRLIEPEFDFLERVRNRSHEKLRHVEDLHLAGRKKREYA